MIFREDKGSGYMYAYAPNHYCANKAGKVMEHVYVMCESIGRRLEPWECVHHRDRDRKNNSLSNLRLMTIAEHAKLHAMEDRGYAVDARICPWCSMQFNCSVNSNQKYCSCDCSVKAGTRFFIDADDLEMLVWSMPTVRVAEKLGVSDVAVSKRCKKLGITKPPRGYWAKVYSGQL